MLFHSVQYLVFLPIVFALFWIARDHNFLRKLCLFTASAVFYMAWNPLPFLLILYCGTSDWVIARFMQGAADQTERRRKWLVRLSVFNNLAILGYFKYANLFYWTGAEFLTTVGVPTQFERFDIILPIGLSFVVFQSMSYSIDVYRGDCEYRRSWLDVLLYVSFFPQLIAGPILRASTTLPQLDAKPKLTENQGAIALLRIAKGLCKKLLIADFLAANIIDRVFASPHVYAPIEIWVGVFAYTLQIYYDFSAYSDIAIGTARLFGLDIPENFNRPYKSRNLTEFWRRWHISLSTWLRDYLYIPLGGNRGGKLGTMKNVMITMFLGGIWHGASWRMGLWGLVHGVGLCMTRMLWWRIGQPDGTEPFWRKALGWFMTFMAVMLARIYFRASSMSNAHDVFRGMVGTGWEAPNVTLPILGVLAIATAIHFSPHGIYERVEEAFTRIPIPARAAGLVAIALIIRHVANFEVQPFIYFQF